MKPAPGRQSDIQKARQIAMIMALQKPTEKSICTHNNYPRASQPSRAIQDNIPPLHNNNSEGNSVH